MPVFFCGRSFAQDIGSVLTQVEENNTTLRALYELNKAEKLENKTGIYPENPEVGFDYLWSDPASIGPRRDFSVMQRFDFPTAYGIRKKMAEVKNAQSDLEFQLQRKTILYRAKVLCNELIFRNAEHVLLAKREEQARELADAFSARFNEGEVNILEKNKAAFHLLNAQKRLEENETERQALLAELAALNGGNPVSFNENTFSPVQLPADFESWYATYEAKIIGLQQSENQLALSEKEISLKKTQSLPKFSGGYMSELVVGEEFRGISVGMSIPLWENKNTVKLAKARQLVAQEKAGDEKIKSYMQLKAQFEKAQSLQKMLASYRQTLEEVNSSELLKKALDAGEISLVDYLLELSLYYDTTDKILSMEKELNQLAAGLYFFEL